MLHVFPVMLHVFRVMLHVFPVMLQEYLPHFCFPWGRPWGNHAKCCMDRKRIRCLQIVSLHVPSITLTVSVIERDICEKIVILSYPLHSTPSLEGFPCADLREILHGPPQMPNVRNRVKILPKILILWVGNTNVSDRRQTDRQTTDTIVVPLAEHNVVTFG